MAISRDKRLSIYRRVLALYVARGDLEKADIQRRLIARAEAEKGG